ncbi:hypothetical protein Q8F55_003421 [Vanrija albida]|uniref:Uncharacterized protein n=1 Tax=Vanrija albida TaxID=181172 RepID=A0ABR3Q448_9TREE
MKFTVLTTALVAATMVAAAPNRMDDGMVLARDASPVPPHMEFDMVAREAAPAPAPATIDADMAAVARDVEEREAQPEKRTWWWWKHKHHHNYHRPGGVVVVGGGGGWGSCWGWC